MVSSLGRNISETVLTKEDHELVTKGPYRWVRHPLYTAGTLLLIGAALTAANALLGALTALAAVLIRLVVVPHEEARLIETFGDAYRDYRRRTGTLLPRL